MINLVSAISYWFFVLYIYCDSLCDLFLRALDSDSMFCIGVFIKSYVYVFSLMNSHLYGYTHVHLSSFSYFTIYYLEYQVYTFDSPPNIYVTVNYFTSFILLPYF